MDIRQIENILHHGMKIYSETLIKVIDEWSDGAVYRVTPAFPALKVC